MRINKRLFQSKTVEDNDILSYHFKEQCRIQRRINATMPHLKSLHDQPSVRVKANGAIVLNRCHNNNHNNNNSIPSDWLSSINDSDDDDDDYDDDDTINNSHSDYSTLSKSSTVSSSQSFLSATPLRKRGSTINATTPTENEYHTSLPTISRSSSLPMFSQLSPTSSTTESIDYHFPYEKKLDILLEEMEDVQQEGVRMKKDYLHLERRNKMLEKELDQRDLLIQSLQSKIQSLIKNS